MIKASLLLPRQSLVINSLIKKKKKTEGTNSDRNYKLYAGQRNLKDVRASCFCAFLLRHVMHRARAPSTKMNNDMADGIALLGFIDLGHSVLPTFLSRNRLYLQLSPHCPKMNKKIRLKISVHGTCNQGAWNGSLMPTCFLRNLTSWLNSLNNRSN